MLTAHATASFFLCRNLQALGKAVWTPSDDDLQRFFQLGWDDTLRYFEQQLDPAVMHASKHHLDDLHPRRRPHLDAFDDAHSPPAAAATASSAQL